MQKYRGNTHSHGMPMPKKDSAGLNRKDASLISGQALLFPQKGTGIHGLAPRLCKIQREREIIFSTPIHFILPVLYHNLHLMSTRVRAFTVLDKKSVLADNNYNKTKEMCFMRQCMDAENLHRRLKKIIGQVQAIDRMVDEDVPCEDILSQINAAKSALHRVGQVVLEGHINHCVRDGIEHGDADQTIANFTKAVERFANMI